MAERSVFIGKNVYPFFEEVRVQFDYFSGFALSQKRKSQISMHQNFLNAYPQEKVLEVSSASLYSLGAELSAMSLKKRTQIGVTTVESAFQSSRVYGLTSEIGPFPDLLFIPGRECKKIVKEKSKGHLCHHYSFDDKYFGIPEHFISLFYNYLYLNALCEPENKDVADQLISSEYSAFTDLATNSLNTQARSCAIYISLVKNGLIDLVTNYDSYLQLFRTTQDGNPIGKESFENVQLLNQKGMIYLKSPVVPCTIRKAEVEDWYTKNCFNLTNCKGINNYLNKSLV